VAAVLGVSAYYHDAAAALVVDGQVVAAIQEERLSRIKNDPSLPVRAIEACLRLGGIEGPELDAVVFYEHPYAKLERVMVELVRGFPFTLRQFPRALAGQMGTKLWVLDQLAACCSVPRDRVRFCQHHESHAASAFYASGYDAAAVLTVDGVGEQVTTAIWHGEGRALRCVSEIHYPHSLGLFYAALTAYLGFPVNSGEHEVMGLASYGEPRFVEEVERLISVESDGSFALSLPHFAHHRDPRLPFASSLERLLGPRRARRGGWDLASEGDRRYADVAASLQAVTERVLLGLSARAAEETGEAALCLAGGVALNAVANGRMWEQGTWSRMFVQPAAGDAGGALGAALVGAREEGDPPPAPMRDVALGVPLDVGRGVALAEQLGLRVERVEDPAQVMAQKILEGQVVAQCVGRFEWGPRALGQRSLLAAPSDVALRERINRSVKYREPFRPFAPATLRSTTMFDGVDNDMTPFMTTVCPVRAEAREALAAVTHVDGTARVQTVRPGGALEPLLSTLEGMGHAPVVLNTSLNGAGEPIVASAEDAVAFLVSHAIDGLFLEDVILRRPS